MYTYCSIHLTRSLSLYIYIYILFSLCVYVLIICRTSG